MEDTRQYLEATQRALQQLSIDKIDEIVDVFWTAYCRDQAIFLLGNGGSAATASHLACDLEKGTIAPGRKGFRIIDLVSNVPLLTAWANDTDYTNIFAARLENCVQAGDILVAISASGNSANVLRAVETAKAHGAVTVGFTGFDGGKLKGLVDFSVVVPSNNMQRIEDVHMILAHLVYVQLNRKFALAAGRGRQA